MIRFIKLAYHWLFSWVWKKETTYRLIELDDVPEETLSFRHVYYVGIEVNKWCIVFLCPCGCGETIFLNTLKNSKPCWRVNRDSKKKFSIRPSVHRQVGCRSHFFIRESKAVFV